MCGLWAYLSRPTMTRTLRFCKFSGDHVVFETCQTMNDIPYGDCFTVDMRWDFKVAKNLTLEGDLGLSVEVHLRVPFSRTCFFRKVRLGAECVPPRVLRPRFGYVWSARV